MELRDAGQPQDVNTGVEGTLLIKYPNGVRDWTTASTMGMLDTNGTWELLCRGLHVQKCLASCPDIDDHGRYVCRHFIYDGAWGVTHGFSSLWGGRAWEMYDGTFKVKHRQSQHVGALLLVPRRARALYQ